MRKLTSKGQYFLLALILTIATTIANVPLSKPAHAAIGTISTYNEPTTDAYFQDINIGSDGNIWYTANGPTINTRIGKLTTSGSFTEYPNRPVVRTIYGLSQGSDGNFWYSVQTTSQTYQIINTSTTGTVIGQYNLTNYAATNMNLGPDGNVWFAYNGGNYGSGIGKITTSGSIAQYSIGNVTNVTSGPDGNVWFTISNPGSSNNSVGKITPSGTVTTYALPYDAEPAGITVGSDGNIWFAEPGLSKIGSVTTSGAITQYLVTGGAKGIATGPDGALWFTQPGAGKIGRITTSGSLSYYTIPGTSNSPSRIVAGSDGAMWFINNVNTIGRVTTQLTSQTVAFTSTAPTNAVIDGTTYTPTASATSGLPVAITVDSSSSSVCSIDGSGVVSYQAVGTCTLDANQGGNVDYNPASQVQQSFTVSPVNADTSVGLSCPTIVTIGSTVTCTITVANNGPAAAENAGLTVAFPSSLTSPSISGGGTISGQYITWNTPSLASGASTTLTFSATAAASASGKAILNAALVQTSPDPNSSDNLASSTILVN